MNYAALLCATHDRESMLEATAMRCAVDTLVSCEAVECVQGLKVVT